jgi:hypothetical protein
MEEAAAVRRAALTAVEDVTPDRLRHRIQDRLQEAALAPGVLTRASAAAVQDGPTEGLADRAAGVQLIYEGLRLTRALAHSDRWDDAALTDPADAILEDAVADAAAADLDILIADILVARGFYLLARTDAADVAVRVVRRFGTDQTVRRETGDATLDANLEADVLELAVVAGTTAAGGRAPSPLREYAIDLADDGLPGPEQIAGADVAGQLDSLVSTDPATPDGVRTSADN